MLQRFWQLGLIVLLALGCLASPVQGQKLDKPTRLPNAAIPAMIALKSHDALWLLDGRDPSKQPQRITAEGRVELVDWSADGKWFAFLRDGHLWVVKADGSFVKQVDTAAIMGMPQWSPVHNQIAYRTWNQAQTSDGVGKVAWVVSDGSIEVESIWEGSDHASDFAWEPGGKCLAIALPRTTQRPLRIDKYCLYKGLRENLWTDQGLVPEKPQSTFVREATGLKYSPDGRYLGYFLMLSSASLSADGVPIGLLDVQTGKAQEIGAGLAYRDWLAWSPDSRTLAYIIGGDRMVTHNKSLALFDARSGTIKKRGARGFVDTKPVWSQQPPYQLLFQRGMETDWPHFDSDTLVVPGQRIWQQQPDGQASVVTFGPPNTADYMPQVTPDGKHLLFLRLKTFQVGSLYFNTAEVVRGIYGRDHGYYGNYLPTWIKVYWNEKRPVAQPGVFALR